MKEIWRPILGYEGLYEISSLGAVKSVARTRKGKSGSIVLVKEKIKSQKKTRDGYLEVTLCKNGKLTSFRVHRLVAFAFQDICGPYFDGAVVNHKDEITTNNSAENLEWCSMSYNNKYSKYKVSTPIYAGDKLFPSIREAERITKIDHRKIKKAIKNNTPINGVSFRFA